MQVLIVEEEQSIASAMAFALESRGHCVHVASDARNALNLPRPDVLIADPELPGISGLDLLEQYRHRGATPRTIFISSAPSLESCRRALRLGASEFLSKPFRLEELVRAVESKHPEPKALFEECYPLSNDVVENCLRDLAAFAIRRGVGPTCRARACSAVGELVENVMRHAYPDAEGSVRMSVTIDERDLTITIIDDGVGMDTAEIIADLMEFQGGLSRAAALSEDIDLRADIGVGTTVQLRFGAYTVDYSGADKADLTELDFLTPETTRQILSTLELEGAESFFQITPALAVVIGRLLAGPDPERLVAQALRS
ncbi:MAG: CheY-like chemotaxis protein [Candidatus Paceibacteria bacterium]|jgi:CheY-like chemotaxis protein